MVITYILNTQFVNNLILSLIITFITLSLLVFGLLALYNILVEHYFNVNPNKGIALNIKFILILIGIISAFTSYQPFYLVKAFYIKQIVLFIFVGSVIIYLSILFFKHMSNKYDFYQQKWLRNWLVLSVVVLLTILSNLQIKYIKNYVIPPLAACSHYTEHDQLIYTSATCAPLKNLKQTSSDTGSELSFDVDEVTTSDNFKEITYITILYKFDLEHRVLHYYHKERFLQIND